VAAVIVHCRLDMRLHADVDVSFRIVQV